MKQILWGRVALAAALVELAMVALMVLLILLFAPQDFASLPALVVNLADWVRPLGGLALCVLAGWWVARKASRQHCLANGIALGVVNVVLDVAISLAMGSVLAPPLLLVIGGRVIGGWLGGWLAMLDRSRR